MTNINIDDDLYKRLVAYYNKQDKLEYSNLKNFVNRTLNELISKPKEADKNDL